MRSHGEAGLGGGDGGVGKVIHFPHKFSEGEKVSNWNSRWESDN